MRFFWNIFMGLYGLFVKAYIGMLLYHWFILETFDKAPTISFLQMLSLVIVYTFITSRKIDIHDIRTSEDATTKDLAVRDGANIIAPWLVLLFHFVLYQFLF